MSKQLFCVTLLFVSMLPSVILPASKTGINKDDLKTNKDKTSYYVGMTLGDSTRKAFSKNEISLDADSLIKGIRDSVEGKIKTEQTSGEMKKQIADYLNKKKDISKEKISYYYGIDMMQTIMKANSWKKVDINLDVLIIAFKRAYKGSKPVLSQDDGFKALVAFTKKEIAKLPVKKEVFFGNVYLAKNAKKKGVVVTKSGLQYEVIKRGKGASPKVTDTVTTHYEGKFTDGKVFDSSLKRGKPTSFPLKGVIAGWTEALQLMKVGDKWRITVPPELGYGKRGAGRLIPANSVLIFEIELLGIKK